MYKIKTLEEMANHQQFSNGLEVNVVLPDLYEFKGKIVGIATTGVVPNYIVECTDDFLPNKHYNYKVVSIPLSQIFPKEN